MSQICTENKMYAHMNVPLGSRTLQPPDQKIVCGFAIYIINGI